VLQLIASVGNDFKFSKDEMSKVSIKTLLSCLETENKDLARKKLFISIKKNQELQDIQRKVLLPPLIFSEKDFDIVSIKEMKPNFVTQKKLSRESIFLKASSQAESLDLSNKIVLIENADPGFDWIFSKNISGLVTKYGGAASHMAIRCSEFGIPAAIGCGEELFSRIINFNKIDLDCKSGKLGGV
jgi:glutamine kinase